MRLTLNAAETGHLVLATMHSANCAEALSRLCMSFAADLQASVRAQLADCLVGISSQRLEFLAAHRLRVPRCEILLPSSGARGTIRAGNFSQITNVIQSGGEEGMWTFDRYQRWIEQQPNWARPAPDAASYSSGAAKPAPSMRAPFQNATFPAGPAPTHAPTGPASPRPATPTASMRSNTTTGRLAKPTPPEDVIEVPAEDLDLAQLAELAKKVVDRNPP
jgi:twitching motility protein PilT